MSIKRIQNSRSDKVRTSLMWTLITKLRLLVPINGFQEWRRRNGKLETAFYITPLGKPVMFLVGICRSAKGLTEKFEVSVITTETNNAMSEVHDRMPVILGSQNAAMTWLQADEKSSLGELMRPATNNALKLTEVSSYVNRSSKEGPECIDPISVALMAVADYGAH